MLDAVLREVATLRVGDPADEAVEMGPVISPEHQARVLGFLERAAAGGAGC